MFDGFSFGWRTAVLAVAAGQMIVIAALLSRTLVNRVANRTLAVLLLVLVGVFTPWMIGFAGFYDRWPWLTFLPVAITLAVAPLLYFYIHALVTDAWPKDARWHLVPPLVQFAFLGGSFLLPEALKYPWFDLTEPIYDAVTEVGVSVGLLFYAVTGLRLLDRYRAGLAQQRSDDYAYAAQWLRAALVAMLVMLPVWAVFSLWNAISPLGYKGYMGLYVAIAAFGLYLAVEGWRQSARAFPRLVELELSATPAPERDWREQAEAWAAVVVRDGAFRDPELSLSSLARKLGTNTGYLSRALNEGLGKNFSTFVNELRCDHVAAALRNGYEGDLLDLALEAGFRSKASFNRAFKARFGVSPSEYRRTDVSKAE